MLIILRPDYPRCNINCGYCPFRVNKLKDIMRIHRIVWGKYIFKKIYNIIKQNPSKKSLFFVPDGELLISRFYKNIIKDSLKDPNVVNCSIQTNLCYDLNDFLENVETQKLMIWTTFHANQYTVEQQKQFFKNLAILKNKKIKFSVGVVATKDRMKILIKYKKMFNDMDIYMWVNGFKGPKYPFYTEKEKEIIFSVDNNAKYEVERIYSKGEMCSAGTKSIFIDGKGDIHKCPLPGNEKIGNIIKNGLYFIEKPEPCLIDQCNCFISYMTFKEMELDKIYGDTKTCRLPLEKDFNNTQRRNK
jgi:MoaA/NifB/PqqE/SkfB family radical SAM enzyme